MIKTQFDKSITFERSDSEGLQKSPTSSSRVWEQW